MTASIFGSDSLYVLIIAIVVLFGGSQLPKLAKNAGEAMKEFRKAHNDAEAATATTTQTSVPAAPLAATPLPPALPTTVPAQVVVPPTAEERVTLSRSELDALLADRENRARAAQSQEAQK
ncbi:MAG TPA: twin-arginine translocase TatA/TatE family subunit [Acidimicrobiales bacterium]|nr:twin-arginine translocase TatA/TatE family subunit [Acidimicrobiales bacterium]